ncbi:MAG: helix-turn-helix transcriptional regulator [Rhizobiaceae bacterium]|nr:helix-turn-helix transcriptional regulator [Rhizobiaceae bacterium]
MSEIVNFSGQAKHPDDTEYGDEANFDRLLRTVGDRVKSLRARKGISRRALSEDSGVSQRYLAQLESGSGNISIGLLLKVANALDFKIEWLVSEEDPWNSDLSMAKYLLGNATIEQRAQVIKMLEPQATSNPKSNRIAFIGLRGAGKSTLGRLASDDLEIPFLELNDEVEKVSGIPVHEVFALYGQEGYRQLERQSLEQTIAMHDSLILAVAGGIVSNPETYNYLLQHFHTIWLKADPEDHMSRVRGQGDERPMAGKPDAMNDLQQILFSRESLYARADIEINTAKKTLTESLEQVVKAIRKNGFLE